MTDSLVFIRQGKPTGDAAVPQQQQQIVSGSDSYDDEFESHLATITTPDDDFGLVSGPLAYCLEVGPDTAAFVTVVTPLKA